MQAEASVACITCPTEEGSESEVCFIVRTQKSEDPWAGHIAFPGGRRDVRDTSLLHTAIRETYEETSIVLNEKDCIQELPIESAGKSSKNPILVQPFLFHLKKRPPTTRDPREVASIFWTPISTLRDPEAFQERHMPEFGTDGPMPGIHLPPYFLWGFTYQVLKKVLETK